MTSLNSCPGCTLYVEVERFHELYAFTGLDYAQPIVSYLSVIMLTSHCDVQLSCVPVRGESQACRRIP